MRQNLFDGKFGEDALSNVPSVPGIYRFFDAEGVLVYVGKATNLRRRLLSYRRTSRRKSQRKARMIVKAAASFDFELCSTDLDALLLENKIIQTERPRLNISGAFSFLYPALGVKRLPNGDLILGYSTAPDLEHLNWFGVFRSREWTKAAYFDLKSLLSYLGHPNRLRQSDRHIPYTWLTSFRNVPALESELASFLMGNSSQFLRSTLDLLLNKRAARENATEIQSCLKELEGFFLTEAVSLAKARHILGVEDRFVSQADRDPLFLRASAQRSNGD